MEFLASSDTTPTDPRKLRALDVYVLPTHNDQIVTLPEAQLIKDKRALPGGVESNALSIARRNGIPCMKGHGPVAFTEDESKIIQGLAYVLAPTHETRHRQYGEAHELHHPEELLHIFKVLGRQAVSLDVFTAMHRQGVILNAYLQSK